MLTERYLASLSDELVELYSVLEYEIKRDMVKRLAKLQKITDATKWSAQIFNEVGGLRSNIDKYVKQYDSKAQSMIKKLFYEALEKNEASDLKYISSAKRKLNANQQQVLNAKLKALEQAESVVNPKDAVIDKLYARFYKQYQYDDVFRSIKRMTMTIADTSQEEFIRECNNAYMKVTSGGSSYQQALKQGVDQLATAPVKTVFYSQSGSLREFSIEAALRMNILTGVNQVASQQTLDNAEEIGVDKYEVSAHIGARWSKYAQNAWSNHSEWQGKIYTREQLETVCGLGYADGLCGINCRHSFYPYIPGTPRLYTKEALEKMNDKTVELYGKKVSQYEAEQELRKTERAIRACKRKAGCEAEVGIDNTKARVRLGELQKQARDICQKAGIKRDYSREYVGTKTGDQVRSLTAKKIVEGVKADTTKEMFHIPDAQFGKKIGKHAADYGLDPSNEADRNTLKNKIIDIVKNSEYSVKADNWRGQSEVIYYLKEDDVVVTKTDGTFVTILKDGVNNARFKEARSKN